MNKILFVLMGFLLGFSSTIIQAAQQDDWYANAKIPEACQGYCRFSDGTLDEDDRYECIACVISVQGESGDVDSRNFFQDLKNFLAYQHLEDQKKDAKLRSTMPPFINDTVFSGVVLDPLNTPQGWLYQAARDALESDLYRRNFLAKHEDNPFPSEDYLPVRSHLDSYCSRYEVVDPGISVPPVVNDAWGLCEADPAKNKPIDLLASSLIGKDLLDTSEDRESAKQYIKNITNFYPLRLLDKDKMFTNYSNKIMTDDGYKLLFDMYRQQSLLSLAQDSYTNMYMDRYPYTTPDPSDPNNQNAQVRSSLLERLDYESNKRFTNPDWYAKMNGTLSTQALLKEMANMMALEASLDFRRSQKLERIEALMAAQLSYLASTISDEARARISASEATD